MEIFFTFVEKANEYLGILLVFGVGIAIPVAATPFAIEVARAGIARAVTP